MRKLSFSLCSVMFGACLLGNLHAENKNTETTEINNTKSSFMETKLNLTQEWDKVFPKRDLVNHSKVTFHNRYGITLAADLYIPKMQKENFQSSLLAARLAQSRNSLLVCMPRSWQNKDS